MVRLFWSNFPFFPLSFKQRQKQKPPQGFVPGKNFSYHCKVVWKLVWKLALWCQRLRPVGVSLVELENWRFLFLVAKVFRVNFNLQLCPTSLYHVHIVSTLLIHFFNGTKEGILLQNSLQDPLPTFCWRRPLEDRLFRNNGQLELIPVIQLLLDCF